MLVHARKVEFADLQRFHCTVSVSARYEKVCFHFIAREVDILELCTLKVIPFQSIQSKRIP